MNNLLLILMAQPAGGQQGNALTSLLPLVLIIVIFYFFMIRPQTKRQKELRKFRDALQKGDKVVTTGGIYGRIVEVKETYLLIEVDTNVKIRVDKAAVLQDSTDIEAAK